jgi:hypothetical protein
LRVPLDSTYLFERTSVGQIYLGPPGRPAPSSGAPEFELLPYDNITWSFLGMPDWELQRTVAITGAVVYPGRYYPADPDRPPDRPHREAVG